MRAKRWAVAGVRQPEIGTDSAAGFALTFFAHRLYLAGWEAETVVVALHENSRLSS
jgi:hypothetical protein